MTRWRTHLTSGSQRTLANLWPGSFVAGVIAWLLVMPGAILLDFSGVGDLGFVVLALSLCILSAFGLLLLTIVAGFARDIRRQAAPAGSQECAVRRF